MAWSDGSASTPAAATGAAGASHDWAPHELLEDGFAPEPCDLLVIGCGNILRGDDAVGPVLIRHLFTRGAPADVRLVDGGTSGMDVAFSMRGANRVVIVDAASTGAEPGTLYRVPAEKLVDLPPMDGLHSHNFRWDHALSLSSWLLGPARPTDITVFLIEVDSVEPGAPLTDAVERGMHEVIDMIVTEFYPPLSVELTTSGSLHLDADLAARHFPADVLLARVEERDTGRTLVLVPVPSAGHGGLVLKQRTAAGDRAVLLSEVLGFSNVSGHFAARWDEESGSLVVDLDHEITAQSGGAHGARGDHDRRPGAGPLDGLSGGHDTGGGGAASAPVSPDPRTGRPVGSDDRSYDSAATRTTEGIR